MSLHRSVLPSLQQFALVSAGQSQFRVLHLMFLTIIRAAFSIMMAFLVMHTYHTNCVLEPAPATDTTAYNTCDIFYVHLKASYKNDPASVMSNIHHSHLAIPATIPDILVNMQTNIKLHFVLVVVLLQYCKWISHKGANSLLQLHHLSPPMASKLRRQWPATAYYILYNSVSMDACNTDLAYISQMTLGP